MSPQLRTVTLAAAETSRGIRVYTKDAEGATRELCNDTAIEPLADGKTKDYDIIGQSKGWFAGELAFPSGPNSALCSFAWASWSQSVIYQDAKDDLREHRHLNKWEATNFVQSGALHGTSVAVVHSDGAMKVVLFYQDKEGFICYRTATNAPNLAWSKESVKLVKAALGTGIGATSWGNLDDIRVYYQDEQNVVREHRGGFDGKWSCTDLSKQYPRLIGDITAVSWRNGSTIEIRLYIQDESDAITELCNSGAKDWYPGAFKVTALAKSDIIAFTRLDSKGKCCALHVLWAGQDQQLWQRVIVPNQGWHPPTPIASVRKTGDYAGSAVGDLFTDASVDVNSKRIAKVRVRCGDIIDSIQLEFSDGTTTDRHGGGGGVEKVFELAADEDIVRVTCVAGNEWVQRLQFETSAGVTSPWYGIEKLNPVSPWYSEKPVTHVWSDEGRALAGFLGCHKQFMKGIKAVWSDRMGSAHLGQLVDFERETTRLEGKLASVGTRLASTKARTASYKTALRGLEALGASATEGLAVFAESVEYLHDLGVGHQKARLRSTKRREEDIAKKHVVCKEESVVLKGHFVALASALAKLRPTGDAIHEDVTQLLRDANATATHTANMTAWSEQYREATDERKKEVERSIQNISENIKRDQANIEAAIAAAKKAETSPAPVQKPGRKLVFTDIEPETSSGVKANLSNDVKELEAALEKDKAQLKILEESLTKVAARLAGIEGVLGRLAKLAQALQTATVEIKELVKETGELQAKAAQYTTVLQQILAAFGPLEAAGAALLAKAFAAVLLEILKLILAAQYLKELLKVSADTLQATMQDVAAYKL